MRLIYLAAFPLILGLLARPPQLDAVAVGAALALFVVLGGRPWADSGPAPTEPPEGWMVERGTV